MAFNVNGLSTYVKENEKALIKDIVLGLKYEGSTIDKLAKQLGVKSKERLHPMSIDPILQDGSNCGFTTLHIFSDFLISTDKNVGFRITMVQNIQEDLNLFIFFNAKYIDEII